MNLGRDLKRVVGVFFSPVTTFRGIGEAPSWLLPALLIAAASVAASYVAGPHIDWDKTVREPIEARGLDLPDDKVQEIVERQMWFGKTVGPWLAPAGTLVFLVLLSLVYWGGTNAFGGRIKFGGAMAVAAWGWLPKLLETLLLMILIQGKEPMAAGRLSEVVSSSPAAFLGDSAGPVLRAFAGCLNAFTLWALGLTGLGLSEAGKLSRSSAFTLIAILFALNVGVWVAFSAVTGQ
jgi:Yip1-like protein